MPQDKKQHSLVIAVTARAGIITLVLFLVLSLLGVFLAGQMLAQNQGEYMGQKVSSVERVLSRTFSNLPGIAIDMAVWAETVAYAQGKNPDYFEKNWHGVSPVENYSIGFLVIKDVAQTDLSVSAYDIIKRQTLPQQEGFSEMLDESSRKAIELYAINGSYQGVSGLIFHDGVPYYAVTIPIVIPGDESAVGTVSMGYVLTDSYLRNLTGMEQSSFSLTETLPANTQAGTVTRKDGCLQIWLELDGMTGSQAFLRITDNGQFYIFHRSDLVFAAVAALLSSLLVFIFVYGDLWHRLLRPLKYLNSRIQDVANAAEEEIDLPLVGKLRELKEIGTHVNGMAAQNRQIRLVAEESQVSINAFLNILNEMDTFIYVTHPENDSIIFLNDKMKAHFNLDDSALGQPCWHVLRRDQEGRCENCPLDRLTDSFDEPIVWEEENSLVGRFYRNTDCLIQWPGSQTVHLQQKVDITEFKNAENKQASRLAQQRLMTEISQSFLTNADSKDLFGQALGLAGTFLEIDRMIVVRVDEEGADPEFVYRWTGGEDHDPTQFISPASVAVAMASVFREQAPDYIRSDDLPRDLRYSSLTEAGVMAFIAVPIHVQGEFWGILTIEECTNIRHWDLEDVQLSLTICSIVSAAIARNVLEDELHKAKELAEHANRAKTNFMSRMSHELRTPMNAIIGMSNIARSTSDPLRKDECITRIDQASHHLRGVIDDMLDITKIEAGIMELSYSEFSIDAMFRKLATVVSYQLWEKNQEMIVKIAPDVPPGVLCDETRLSQILTNLMSNAIKYNREGGIVTLEAFTAPHTEPGYCLLSLKVADTGIGIEQSLMDTLFDPYQDGDNGAQGGIIGTGLGLSIAKSIVDLLDGQITVSSVVGEGSVFTVTLPVEIGKNTPAPCLDSIIDPHKLCLLAIDASPEIRAHYNELGTTLGTMMVTAEGGNEAIDLITAAQTPFDMILIDRNLTDINSYELARRIRNKYSPQASIIMIASCDWTEEGQDVRLSGVDRILTKPLFSSAIIECINDCLGKSAGEGAAALDAYDGLFAGRHILVAEDMEINREILNEALLDTNIVITWAENGRLAVQQFSRNPDAFEMIFMDVHMPEMDGLTATRTIRTMKLERAKTIPIVAMTANVLRHDVEKCFDAGMNDHLAKPIYVQEVLDMMKKYIIDNKGAVAPV